MNYGENIVEVGVTEYNYNHKIMVVEKSNYNDNNYLGLQSNYHTDSHTPNNYFHHNSYF